MCHVVAKQLPWHWNVVPEIYETDKLLVAENLSELSLSLRKSYMPYKLIREQPNSLLPALYCSRYQTQPSRSLVTL